MKWQVFRSEEDWFVTAFPASFRESTDEDGKVFTPAEVVEAETEDQAVVLAGEQ
ncbi:MAG: hypothetical protein GY788_07435 [bacterium]|nr:hypothetical protein [bacterium]